MFKKFTFINKDQIAIQTYKWDSVDTPKGIVQIAHGMAETATRYNYFAQQLNIAGYIVVANDHRGHGQSSLSVEDLGYISDNDGFEDMVEDMKQLNTLVHSEYPTLPIILFGHSMGSFLSQRYIQLYGDTVQGVILSGSNGKQKPIVNAGILLSKLQIICKGRKSPANLVDKMAFGTYNSKFKDDNTQFAWLSRDKEQVSKYMNDPYCGTLFPVSFFYDFLRGLKRIHIKDALNSIPKHLPIYIFSGDMDPVGDYGRGVKSLYNTYKNLSITDIEYKLYTDGRHEMLNELNKDEVIIDVIHWITNHIK